MRHQFDPWVEKIPWMRAWQPTPVFLPRESHGQRSLGNYSTWGRKESDMTEVTQQHRCIVRQILNHWEHQSSPLQKVFLLLIYQAEKNEVCFIFLCCNKGFSEHRFTFIFVYLVNYFLRINFCKHLFMVKRQAHLKFDKYCQIVLKTQFRFVLPSTSLFARFSSSFIIWILVIFISLFGFFITDEL